MAQLRQDFSRIVAANLNLIVVAPNRPEAAQQFRAAHDFPFPIYADYARAAYRRYELGKMSLLHEFNPLTWLRNLKQLRKVGAPKSSDADMLQLGGVFIIDQSGRLRYTHVAEEASDNPTTDEVLQNYEM